MPEGRKPESDSNTEEVTRYLLDRISSLENRNIELREENRQVESEKKFLESQKTRYEREIRKLKGEIEKLRSPPLIIGKITDVAGDNRYVVQSSAGPVFMVRASGFIEPEDLKAGVRCTLNQQSLAIVDLLPQTFDSQVYGMEVEDPPVENYSDIGGLEDQILEIKEAVELPLCKPELFEKVGISPPRGVLLHGPPGTGKTLLARAVAHETNAKFLRVVGSELVQKYIGEGARLVRELFELAKRDAPSIIFIDEIDAIGAQRTESLTSGDREVQRTLMQLLADLDGFKNRGDVKIIGATNRIDILDPALLRPGRFDRMIEIPEPDVDGRYAILKIHSKNMSLGESIYLENIAELTERMNGSDLKSICTEAGMFAIRDDRDTIEMADFVMAIDKVRHNQKGSVSELSDGAMFA
ncbi:proteasome-activating nucleotidase [Methanoplanus sp. FWC-SCC4]|uniref:Proteasome-activating nucleotidase n=1 Tax=Methanochimaera problematica TaxID=2609417 RepID=A0AA97I376_9EURY|nr:proteasome-activating nucleotidase [Methanoplanus sp. FWC-SCC4]WOF15596.1 proteasome-activating nucleotidase [Methanoplanus sp. FWC-SCC4]